MKVAIMQPYFFPYLGYIGLIKHTDRFIILDTVQYIRNGWINRNRISKRDGDWHYINVPLLSHSRNTLIQNIRINNETCWGGKILAQMEHYKKKAPYYKQVVGLLGHIFSNRFEDIVSLNKAVLQEIFCYLEEPRDIEVFSQMSLTIDRPTSPDEWCLNICKSLENVTEYWNPPGGKAFYDRSKYEASGIKLRFIEYDCPYYDQKQLAFQPGLSILDVMMFNSVVEIHDMLDCYVLT